LLPMVVPLLLPLCLLPQVRSLQSPQPTNLLGSYTNTKKDTRRMQTGGMTSPSGTCKSVSLAQVMSQEVNEGEASYMLHQFVSGCENDPIYGCVNTKDLASKCFGWGETVETPKEGDMTKFPQTHVNTAAPFLYEHVAKEVIPLVVNQRLECNKCTVTSSGFKVYYRCNVNNSAVISLNH
jgi:hypothetical protein